MLEAARLDRPDAHSRSPILELPGELRLKIYTFIHEKPQITIQHGKRDDYHRASFQDEVGSHIQRINFESQDPGVPDYLFIAHQHYDWQYLLTCRKIHQEAQHLLPQMLHLRILILHFDVQHVPPAVRSRYLPHIPILTIIGNYPVYDTEFDGSQLPSLKTLYLHDDGPSSRINQQFGFVTPAPPDFIARIQGADDHEYIQKSLRKFRVSKLNWWQAEKITWLQSVLSADLPRNFQLIISQDIRIRLIGPLTRSEVPRYVSLELLFDAANGALICRKVTVPGDEQELLDEGDNFAYFRRIE